MLKTLINLFKKKEKIKPKPKNFDGLEALYLDDDGCITYNEDYFDAKYPGYVATKDNHWEMHQKQFKQTVDAAKEFILHVENLNYKCDDSILDTIEGSYSRICELTEWYKATQLPGERPFVLMNGAQLETGEFKIYFEI